METLLNTLSPIFKQYDFHSNSHSHSSKICYKNASASASPYDEFIVEMFPKTNEIVTIVPVGSVPYKKTFIDMNTAVDYMKMHLGYYQASNSN